MTSVQPTSADPAATQSHMPRRLLIVLATAVAVVLAGEWAAGRWLGEPADDTEPQASRPQNVTMIPKDPALLPAPRERASVWMLGNSHTYALPGLKQGDPLRTDVEGIAIDELAKRLGQRDPAPEVDLYLLSYPNFLPFEMLTRVAQLLSHGHRPTVVLLGLTWRNIARDSQLRHEIYSAFRDPQFVAAFDAMLARPEIQADPQLLKELQAQQARAAHDEEVERLRSDSDRLDEWLTGQASQRLTLMGRSNELRANIFRGLTEYVQRQWDDRQNVKYTYDLVEQDFQFNRACLRAMLRLLKDSGATVLCYYAPQRSDLPPLVDPVPQEKFMAEFNAEAEGLGIAVVDARDVVPNEYWGWVGESPDRSHFTQTGHQLLADFLLREAYERGVWKKLEQQP